MLRALAVVVLVAAAGCGDSGGGAPDLAVVTDMAIPLDMARLQAECDVFANKGCAAGQKCTIGTDHGSPRDLCFAVSATTVGDGADCVAVTSGDRSGDNCAPGLICLDFPGDGPHCHKPCYVRSHCGGGEACVFSTPTGTQRMTEGGVQVLGACAADTGCDPVAQTVCTGGRKCWLSLPDDVARAAICLDNRTPGMAGASCAAQADCAPGFRCDGLGFCRRFCYFRVPDGGVAAGAGSCPAVEGVCDRFAFPGPVYGVCGSE